MSTLAATARRHPLASYFVVTFVVSYLIAAPLVLDAQGLVSLRPPGWLHYGYSLGPIAGALAVTVLVGGSDGIRDLVGRMTRWHIGVPWLLVAIGSPFGLFALAAIVMRLSDGSWPDLSRLGEVNYLGNIGLWVVPLWIVSYGYGEETGWRGFALPQLQARHSALVSALLVAAGWMLWHLPAFLYLPTYTNLEPVVIPFFFIGVACGSILLTWMYNGTGGSVFAVAMWHAAWDLVSASKASEGTPAAVMTTVIVLWAIAIVVVGGAATLTRGRKAVPSPA